MWQKTITVRNNNVAYRNNQMSIKKNFEATAVQLRSLLFFTTC